MIPDEVPDAKDWEEALAAALQALEDIDIDTVDVRNVEFGRRHTGAIYWSMTLVHKLGSGKLHFAPFKGESERRREMMRDVIRHWAKRRDHYVHPQPEPDPDPEPAAETT